MRTNNVQNQAISSGSAAASGSVVSSSATSNTAVANTILKQVNELETLFNSALRSVEVKMGMEGCKSSVNNAEATSSVNCYTASA